MPPAIPSCPPPDTTTTAAGACATTTWAVALSASNDAVTVPDPFATALTTPVGVTVNTPGSLLDHPTVPANASPNWSVRAALNAVVSPSDESVADSGEMASTAARRAGDPRGGSGPRSSQAARAATTREHRRMRRRPRLMRGRPRL